jgi:hypothetical protein
MKVDLERRAPVISMYVIHSVAREGCTGKVFEAPKKISYRVHCRLLLLKRVKTYCPTVDGLDLCRRGLSREGSLTAKQPSCSSIAGRWSTPNIAVDIEGKSGVENSLDCASFQKKETM